MVKIISGTHKGKTASIIKTLYGWSGPRGYLVKVDNKEVEIGFWQCEEIEGKEDGKIS